MTWDQDDPILSLKHYQIITAAEFFFFSRENKAWHFMRILCATDNSHEMPCPVFNEN